MIPAENPADCKSHTGVCPVTVYGSISACGIQNFIRKSAAVIGYRRMQHSGFTGKTDADLFLCKPYSIADEIFKNTVEYFGIQLDFLF